MCFLFDVRIVCASNKTFWKPLNNGWYTESNKIQSSTRGLKSLLNKVPWVPKCPSGGVPKCLECRVHKYPSSVGVAQFPKCRRTYMGNCFECSSTQVPFECLWMSNFPLSALWAKKVCNITKNGVVNSFIEFFKTFSEYIFYITLIVFSVLGNKMCKFYQVLLARCSH